MFNCLPFWFQFFFLVSLYILGCHNKGKSIHGNSRFANIWIVCVEEVLGLLCMALDLLFVALWMTANQRQAFFKIQCKEKYLNTLSSWKNETPSKKWDACFIGDVQAVGEYKVVRLQPRGGVQLCRWLK